MVLTGRLWQMIYMVRKNEDGEYDQVNLGTPEYKTENAETSEDTAAYQENESDDAWMESFKQAVYDCADQDWQALAGGIPESVWEKISETTSFSVKELMESYQEDSLRNMGFVADMETWRIEEAKEVDTYTLETFREMFGLENTTRGVWLDVTFTDADGSEKKMRTGCPAGKLTGEWICFCIEIG